jgi:hypothetical protein
VFIRPIFNRPFLLEIPVSKINWIGYILCMTDQVAENRKRYIPSIVFFVVSVIFAIPLLLKWNYIGPRDWELFTVMAAIPVKTVIYFNQFPFWNPYIGGGNILFAHPEVAIFTPFFLLLLVFGAVGGLKLQVLLAYFVGFLGTYYFAKRLGLSVISAYLVSFVYFGSSYFGLHFSSGHMPFTHFCFLPWFLYFLLKADDNRSHVLAGGLTISLLILGNGAAVPFLYTAFFSGLLILFLTIENKSIRYLKYYFGAIVIGFLLSAVKFFPMITELVKSPWVGRPDDFTPASALLSIFFSFDQYMFRGREFGLHWPWLEYGAYISPVVILLSIIGIIYRFARCRIWLILALFFLIFGLGHFSDYSLWNLFMNLPGFASMRVPSRTFQFVVLGAGVMAGFGLDHILEKYSDIKNILAKLAGLFVGLVIAGNFLICLPSLNKIDYKLPDDLVFEKDFRQEMGGMEEIYSQFQRNRGSLIAPWLSAYKDSRGLVSPINEIYMEYVSEGELELVKRNYTPNRVEYMIRPKSDGVIVFSIGYDPGWFAEDGRDLFELNGLVATRFTSYDKDIVLKYRTPNFYIGLVTSLIISIGILIVRFNRKARHRFEAIFK